MLSHERFENVDKTNDLACIKKCNCKEHFEINHYYFEKAVNENFMIDWPLNRLVFTQNFKIIGHLLWL